MFRESLTVEPYFRLARLIKPLHKLRKRRELFLDIYIETRRKIKLYSFDIYFHILSINDFLKIENFEILHCHFNFATFGEPRLWREICILNYKRCTSSSRSMANFSATRSFTRPMSACTSDAFAFKAFTIKFGCFGEIIAPPKLTPLRPDSEIR